MEKEIEGKTEKRQREIEREKAIKGKTERKRQREIDRGKDKEIK